MRRSRSGIGAAGAVAIGLVVGLLIGVGGYALLAPAAVSTTFTQTNTATVTLPAVTTVSTATATSTITTTFTTTSQASSNSSFPTLPAPAAVTVNPKTTAFLVLDYVYCSHMTGCNATLPTVSAMLNESRAAGALIIFTGIPPAPLTNKTGETVITNDIGPDKYYNTSLQSILQSHGITTVIIAGIAANGALLYTAQESCVRGFTVVVLADTIIGTSYVQSYVPYQLLNGPGCSNAKNTPLTAAKATLSSTALVTYTSG